MNFTIEQIKRAVESKGFEMYHEYKEDYYIKPHAEYKKLFNTLPTGTILIRISAAIFNMKAVPLVTNASDDPNDNAISIQYNNKVIKGNSFYRFVPLSWLKPKVDMRPEWM